MALPSSFPELGALDLFVSVVELGSLSRAAEAHQIAQPSASARIRNLERRLGLTLLERSPTGSTPTAEGAVVAGWSAGVLRAADELAAGVAALKAEASGLLRIAASYTVAEYLLPPWLEQFLRNRVDDSVSLRVTNSAAVVEQLARGEVDLGFIESPSSTAGVEEQTVAVDDLVVVVAGDHPWVQRPSVPVGELAATPLVLREPGSGTREALEEALRELGHGAPRTAIELGSTAAVRMAVITGSTPTVISRLAVEADLDAGSLVAVTIPGLAITRRLRALWPRGRDLPELTTALLAQLPNLP